MGTVREIVNEDVTNTVMELSELLGVQLNQADIFIAYRLPAKKHMTKVKILNHRLL